MENTAQSSIDRPIIDELFVGIVFGDSGVWERLATRRAREMIAVRAVVCTSSPGDIDLDIGRGIGSNEYVVPILEGPRARFVSRHTSVQARLNGGRSSVVLDHSLSFDSNFAERLRAILNGRDVGEVLRNRVLSVLMLKATRPHVQFDVLPFLYENARLVRDDDRNERVLDTVIAFRMLDHVDWEAFRARPGVFGFCTDAESLRDSLRAGAAETIAEFLKSEDVARFETKSLSVQALLLRLATLWRTSKDRQCILSSLVDFCVFELGFVPTTELSVIWCGLSRKSPARFLGPVTGPSKEILKKTRAMAWDLTHLRLLERSASQSVLGSFYIPHYVSFDEKWRELLRLNPVRFMLFDDSSRMLVGRAYEAEFRRACNACKGEAGDSDFSNDKVAARRATASKITLEDMHRLVDSEARRYAARASARGDRPLA